MVFPILSHDALHQNLFTSKKWNYWCGQYFFSTPFIDDVMEFWTTHKLHHRFEGSYKDPDLHFDDLEGIYPIATKIFIKRFLLHLVGYFWILRIWEIITWSLFKFLPQDLKNPKRLFSYYFYENRGFYIIIFWQVTLFSLFSQFSHWSHYFYFWLVPNLTIIRAIRHIRHICEHRGLIEKENYPEHTRSIKPSWLHFFFAPVNVNLHLEHHLFPQVPCYRLKKLYNYLMKIKHYPRGENSYFDVLSRLVSLKIENETTQSDIDLNCSSR